MKWVKQKSGFSIIELLVAIAIIAIIASFSIKYYTNQKERAILTQDGMEIAKNCIGDLISFCVDHPNGQLDPTKSVFCKNRYGIFGNVTYTVDAPQNTCNGSQLPDGYTVKVYSSAAPHYHIECKYKNESYRCYIQRNS